MTRRINVSGVGCCLVDRLFNKISFSSETFSRFLSKEKGDGGLMPGKLVLAEEFEKFAGMNLQHALNVIIPERSPDKINIGGPCIVSMIHAAQMLESTGCTCRFYGCGGNDEDGRFLLSSLKETPVCIDHYRLTGRITPSTIVLSDPTYDHGHGERIFINTIGAARQYSPDDLDKEFFSSDVVVFGGTALVPAIHDNLTGLLERAKSKGCVSVVNTVFDFINEKANPTERWPLGKSDQSYRNIDLLITDCEESLRLSGESTPDEALQFFRDKGTGAAIITNGSKNIRLFSNGSTFSIQDNYEMPVSEMVTEEIKKGHHGDTTGCGDNFVGGVIASLVSQLQKGAEFPDIKEACMWGIVSGGYACFYLGGTYFEKAPGEKRRLIISLYNHYKTQISRDN